MTTRDSITAIAKTIWPDNRIELAAGFSRHCNPAAAAVSGLRLLVFDENNKSVDAMDAETPDALIAKIEERGRENMQRQKPLRRRAALFRHIRT